MQVPFFDWKSLYLEKEEEFSKIISKTLKKGAFILQADVSDFEVKLRNFLGIKHVVAVADGTNAILLGLRASGVRMGDEVILPSHSFIAAAQSIHHAGARPIPVEMSEEDWLISTEAIEAAITKKREHIYHAALLDPLTSANLTIDEIYSMTDKMIEAHGNYLPKYN